MTCFYPTNGLNPSDKNEEERKERDKSVKKADLGKQNKKNLCCLEKFCFSNKSCKLDHKNFLEGKYVQFMAKPCFLYRSKISLYFRNIHNIRKCLAQLKTVKNR